MRNLPIEAEKIALLETALQIAADLVKTYSHTMDCQFSACTCGAVQQRAELMSEFHRIRRQIARQFSKEPLHAA